MQTYCIIIHIKFLVNKNWNFSWVIFLWLQRVITDCHHTNVYFNLHHWLIFQDMFLILIPLFTVLFKKYLSLQIALRSAFGKLFTSKIHGWTYLVLASYRPLQACKYFIRKLKSRIRHPSYRNIPLKSYENCKKIIKVGLKHKLNWLKFLFTHTTCNDIFSKSDYTKFVKLG